MLRTFVIGSAFALFSGAASAAPLSASDGESAPGAEPSSSTMQSFLVPVDSATTQESVIPAILAAGRAELIAACESNSGASVRIYNPMASGGYVDVPCAVVLGGTEGTGQAAEALPRAVGAPNAPNEGATGEARQRLTPLAPLICALLGGIASTAQDRVCRDWRGRNSEFCNVGTFSSTTLWSVGCWLAF